jgi:hypothetical protein
MPRNSTSKKRAPRKSTPPVDKSAEEVQRLKGMIDYALNAPDNPQDIKKILRDALEGSEGAEPPYKSSAREIAEHVAAIMRHPDTPEDLIDGLIHGMADLDTDANVHKRFGYIEAILLTHFENEQKGAR